MEATQVQVIATATLLSCSLLGGLWYWTSRPRKEKWTLVGYLDEIFVYPISAGKAKGMTSAYFDYLGLRSGPFMDRIFMIVDEK